MAIEHNIRDILSDAWMDIESLGDFPHNHVCDIKCDLSNYDGTIYDCSYQRTMDLLKALDCVIFSDSACNIDISEEGAIKEFGSPPIEMGREPRVPLTESKGELEW